MVSKLFPLKYFKYKFQLNFKLAILREFSILSILVKLGNFLCVCLLLNLSILSYIKEHGPSYSSTFEGIQN